MKAQRTFKVEILTEKEAIELFYMKVGEETLKLHPDIPNLAKEMAKECKGLPLALIVVGSAMAGVTSLEAWKDARNHLMSSSWTASEWETKVFSILKFSYDRLPDKTHKNCFLYCALYPEDYEIGVVSLIDKWMGEGFLGKYVMKSIQDMRGHGESVIEKLKQSCLLESVEDDLFMSRTIKLHDVIRDLALWLARDQNKNKKKILVEGDALAVSQEDVETWKIVERISMIEQNVCVSVMPCPNLRTLTFGSDWLFCSLKNMSNFQYMRNLKVLDLSLNDDDDIDLPPEIGSLILLEYLSLSGKKCASKLPIELKNLKNLKFFTLHVSRGGLAIIPLEVISSLKQLRVLRSFITPDVLESEEEREFLEKLESLPKLEVLCIHITTKDGLKKLLKSTKLQNCMQYLLLAKLDTSINMPSLLASMSRMKHLREICLRGLAHIMEDSSIFDTCYLSMLHKVCIMGCFSIVHLTWLKYAPILQDLEIGECMSLKEVIKGGTEDNRENEEHIFPFLVRLELWDLPELKSIYKKALLFPKLKDVVIIGCPNLKKLPFDSNGAMEKLRHIGGEKKWWDELEWEDPGIKQKFHSVFQPC